MGRIRIGEAGHFLQDASQINFFKPQLTRPGEVNQDLNDAIEAVNLVADDVHVTARVGINLVQFVLQKLQMQNDRVDRVLDFVGDAACGSCARGETTRQFQFRLQSAVLIRRPAS